LWRLYASMSWWSVGSFDICKNEQILGRLSVLESWWSVKCFDICKNELFLELASLSKLYYEGKSGFEFP